MLTGAVLAAPALVIGGSAWHLAHERHVDVLRPSIKFGMVAAVLAGLGVTVTGDLQAEAIYTTQPEASFSVFTIGSLDGTEELFSIRVPYLPSYLATGSFTGTVEGIDDVQREYEQRYGPGDYRPVVPVTYWGFRLMIGLGVLNPALALLGLWLMRRGRLPDAPWFWRALVWTAPLPLLANSFGWLFTEMGRQPWVVFSQMFTRDAVSPAVPSWQVALSLTGFSALYLALAVVELGLRPPGTDQHHRPGVGCQLGLPLGRDGDFVGNVLDLFNPYALLGGLLTASLFVTHGAVFVALRTRGVIRHEARTVAARLGVVTLAALVVFLLLTVFPDAGLPLVLAVANVAALAGALAANARGREGWAFGLTAGSVVLLGATLFTTLYPNVLPATTDPDFSLTIANASATPHTLTAMSWVALLATPFVLAYQGWTYWVFRKRLSRRDVAAPPPVAGQRR